MAVTIYPGANTTAQWFARSYPGVIMSSTPRLVLHTTESSGWPAYQGGANAPTMTIKPNMTTKKLEIRQHFPLNMSARALRNRSGGVQTNTAGVIQIELVGTSERNGPGLHWASAPDWVRQELAKVIATLHRIRGVPLRAMSVWREYPGSYGNTGTRMTFGEWLSFKGVCGHQHVPENDHGDPSNLPMTNILSRAVRLAYPPKPIPVPITPPKDDDMAVTSDDILKIWAGREWKEYYDKNGNLVQDPMTPINALFSTHSAAERALDEAALARADVKTLSGSVAGVAKTLEVQRAEIAALKTTLDKLVTLLQPPATTPGA